MSKVYSQSEVASHSKLDDLWIVINNEVFDVTRFQDDHPGGNKGREFSISRQAGNTSTKSFLPAVIQRVGGKDATKQFQKYHRDAILNKYKQDLQVGTVEVDTKPKSTSLFSFLHRKK